LPTLQNVHVSAHITPMNAKQKLIQIIEREAIDSSRPFIKAAQDIVSRSEYFQLMLTAYGGYWRVKPPTPRLLRAWRDPKKLALAKKYPDITYEEHLLASPYLPVNKRPRDYTKENQVKLFKSKGLSAEHVAEMVGVSRATVYRYLKLDTNQRPDETATRKPKLEPKRKYNLWKAQAEYLMETSDLSRKEIAKIVGISAQRIYRLYPNEKGPSS